MSIKHYCDVCDNEIPDGSGYTVTWEEQVNDGGPLVSRVADREERNICDSCWPGEDEWYDGLRGWLK